MKKLAPVLVASVVAVAVASPAWSGDDDENPMVSYRHTVMESMGGHMKASSLIMKGKVDRTSDLVAHAEAIHESSKIFTELFPPETAPDKVKSDSKAEIWAKWDDFVKANKVLEDESAKLVEVAKTGDLGAFKAQFGKVGGACGDCHDAFRVDD